MAKKTVGYVVRIGINPHKVSVVLKLGELPEKKLVLFNEPNAAVIPQVELASRSMMLSLLQGAQAHKLPVIATHEENGQILALHVLDEKGLDFDFDFSGDADDGDAKKKPLPDGIKPGRPQRKRPQPA
jgi:hypothetical protein